MCWRSSTEYNSKVKHNVFPLLFSSIICIFRVCNCHEIFWDRSTFISFETIFNGTTIYVLIVNSIRVWVCFKFTQFTLSLQGSCNNHDLGEKFDLFLVKLCNALLEKRPSLFPPTYDEFVGGKPVRLPSKQYPLLWLKFHAVFSIRVA